MQPQYRNRSFLLLAAAASACLLAAGAGLAYFWFTSRADRAVASTDSPRQKDISAAEPKPKGLPAIPPKDHATPPKPPTAVVKVSPPATTSAPVPTPIAPPPRAPAPKILTFDEAYAQAEAIADKLSESAAADTASALKLLTPAESGEARLYMSAGVGQVAWDPIVRAKALALGLNSHVVDVARKLAMKDKNFKPTIRLLHGPNWDPKRIVAAMGYWGQIDPGYVPIVVQTVEAGMRPFMPEVRNAVLLLGGKKWLESLP